MSVPLRFFATGINYPACDEVTVDGEEFVHAVTVLRVAAGTEIILLDGSGKEYTALAERVDKRSLTARITGVRECRGEPRADIYLLCGFLKNADKNETVVQKAVELGAGKIAFFGSEYGSAYMNGNKLERLNRVSREAAKQCLRARAPQVVYFPDIKSALGSADGYDLKIFAYESEERSQTDLSSPAGSVALVAGSEGGFSAEEYAYAKSLGFKGVTLGKRILRAETAAIALCVIAARALGELG